MKNLVGVALVCWLLSVGGSRPAQAQKTMTATIGDESPAAQEDREAEEAAKKEKARKQREAEAPKKKKGKK